ncbi:protein-L-isoaspartate(D-aspartate) O-methyltransferase [Tepidimonas sp.]|uniref:protein-L-isoaspartate(D-aspartate) O-methyltransferase n=1 Tax=Tepidimonas sp. TaxID=2002775 RepID=UPI003FCD7224
MVKRHAGVPSGGQPPTPRFPVPLHHVAPTALGGGVPARTRAARSTPAAAVGVGLDSSAVRQAMVRRLQAMGVTHPAVLQAFGRVERHRFVDSALAAQAYEDTSLPIGWGQTISKPSVVARMLELLVEGQVLPLGRVLEIGTGCGYQAALLSSLCREVYSIERVRALHDKAREHLRPLRIPNVHLILGDGMPGFARGAPYAGIIAAAGGDDVPQAWVQQLAVGGRLVAPAQLQPGRQSLVVVDRTAAGWQRRVLEDVCFVPLKSGLA